MKYSFKKNIVEVFGTHIVEYFKYLRNTIIKKYFTYLSLIKTKITNILYRYNINYFNSFIVLNVDSMYHKVCDGQLHLIKI